MAKTRYFAKFGLINKSYATTPAGFDLTKWLERSLDTLHIPKVDECCDSEATSGPIRFNTEDGVQEYFNPADFTWTPITSGDVTTDSITLDDGLVSDLAIKIGADTNNGVYGVSDTQLGFAVEGVLVGGFNTTGLFTNTITEQTTGVGISLLSNTIKFNTLAAHDTTGLAIATEIVGGVITSTSAAAVSLTLPTVAAIVAATSATRGTVIDFSVDNGVGANTVTVIVGTGMTASSAITGGTVLTVASGVVGQFRLYIQSGTTAKLSRVA